ncbi:MAG: folate-binding protein YgfZ [Nitrosospira multiformis]|nr:folate-binding protein YgfZ [Nitrosospira multiformis]
MNPVWRSYLQSRGAIFREDCIVGYGNAAAELESTQSANVLSDLSHFGLIHFWGEDAGAFLQGQLSCDIRRVTASAASYGSYCNPKGRILATFLILRAADDSYLMQLPAMLLAGIQKRLAMYVLRTRVKLADSSGTWVRMGVAGSHAAALLGEILGEIPAVPLGVRHGERGSIIRLAENRFQLLILPEQAPAIWEDLSRNAVPVGKPCWDWLEIRAGIPHILPATQEQFVPQMVNLDALGGISFQKGCYPGQEIVARTQYLGKVKRRMYLANVRAETCELPIEAGDELFSTGLGGEQSAGMVVNPASSSDGGTDLLAVIQASSVEAGEIHWKSLEGPALGIMPLPYSANQ